ncbi:MAG: hypothetical protein ACI8W3_002373 [Myxococcota bacterium]|jgi:hypothetical protein
MSRTSTLLCSPAAENRNDKPHFLKMSGYRCHEEPTSLNHPPRTGLISKLSITPPYCRSQHLNIQLARVSTKPSIHRIVDSTGLSIVGKGEWAAAKYGGRGRRSWKKLYIGVDESGLIVAEALTHGSADDAKMGLALAIAVEADIDGLTADAAYDTLAIYDASITSGAEVVIPPSRSAAKSRQQRSRLSARDRTIMRNELSPIRRQRIGGRSPSVEEGGGLSSTSPD